MELDLMSKLVEEDFGIELTGANYARSVEHSSLVIDRGKQVFYFNAQQIVGTPLTYLIKIRGWTYSDSIQYLKQFPDFKDTIIYDYNNGEETVVYPKLIEIFHDNLLREDRTYFYKRTITDESINRFQLGYDEEWYMIPIFMNGIFKNFQKRRDLPNKQIKNYYRNIGPLLFNSDIMRITSKVFFTEAPTSCIVLNQNSIPCVSMTSGANGFQKEWYGNFINQKEIVLLFDNDEAGNRGSIQTSKILGTQRCRIYNFWDYDEKGYDAGNFFEEGGTKDQLMELVETKGKYSFEMEEMCGTKYLKR